MHSHFSFLLLLLFLFQNISITDYINLYFWAFYMSPVVLYQYTSQFFFLFLRDHNGNKVAAFLPQFSILMNFYLYML